MDKGTALSRDEAIDLVRQYKHIIARHFAEEPQVLIYGSYSKGNANQFSDIDVAVVVSTYGDRKLELSKALWRDVDDVSLLIEPVLISKDHPSPLYDDIMRTGIAV